MAVFRVADMTCGNCAGRIKRALVTVDDKAQIEINLHDRLVRISGTVTEAEFAETIQEAGYTPETIDPTSARGRQG